MTIWFDVEDLFEYAGSGFRPSGIQRLSYELYVAVRTLAPAAIGFVRHDRPAGTMRVVEWADVEAIYSTMSHVTIQKSSAATSRHARPLRDVAGLRLLAARLPREVALPLGEAARAQFGALRCLWRAARAIPGAAARFRQAHASEAQQATGAEPQSDLREIGRPTDILASFGAPWSFPDYSKTVDRIATITGMRFAMLVSDLIPQQIGVSALQRVLQALVNEQVSIRDLPTILEGVQEALAANMRALPAMLAVVRAKLSRQISEAARGPAGHVPLITLSADWEVAFIEALVGPAEERQLAMDTQKLQEFLARLRSLLELADEQGENAVLLCAGPLRPHLRAIVERFRPATAVLAQAEIHPRVRIRTLGSI